jgi:HK97 family phage major capsid protein
MNHIETLQAEIEERQARIDELVSLDDITPEQDAQLTAEVDAQRDALAKRDELEARAAAVAEVRAKASTYSPGTAPTFIRKAEQPTPTEARFLSHGEARDAAMRVLETAGNKVTDRSAEHIERLMAQRSANVDGSYIAKRLLLTENDAYRSAFAKGIASATPAWTSEEARALSEFRAASIGTDAAGGFGVPVLIDPTILVSSGAADVPLLRVARVETITNDEWKGVSSAAAAWSWDGETGEVSDDMTTLAQPTVTAHKAQAFIPFSIEVGMDYPNFAGEMGKLLEQGYMDLLAAATATGTGSSQPFGIFTAIDATVASEVVVTTDGSFGAVDIDKVWAALPERFRRNAKWFMNVDVENEIRAFGSGTATSRFTVDQTKEGISLLNGKEVLLSDSAPTFTGTTGASNILVVGDFSNYLVAQRAGMNVELIPHLFATANNRPSGSRGLYAYVRVGADSIVDNSFRLLQNQ